MIDVVVPSREETLELQRREDRLYWSRCAELLFRREGFVSVRRVLEPAAGHFAVLCRGTAIGPAPTAGFIEGPLGTRELDALGLSADAFATGRLDLSGGLRGGVFLPQIQVRDRGGPRRPLDLTDGLGCWASGPIPVQFLSGEGWEPMVIADDERSGRSGAVVVRRGGLLVAGVPLLDVLLRWMAVPPLAERYAGFDGQMPHVSVAGQLVGLCIEQARAHGCAPPVRVSRWPVGRRAALTVRHDYDRHVDAADLVELLGAYARLGVKASIGFLPQLLERVTIELFRDAGHEIQAHVASPSRDALRRDVALLRATAGAPVRGVTVHGGPNGLGFRGQTHFEWFDDLGIDYCETFGLRGGVTSPVCRLHDELPDISTIVAMPGHHSLDGSTRPDDHHLDALRDRLPKRLSRGEHVIVMNHPDVHRDELCALLGDLPLDGVWCATAVEVARWQRTALYESTVAATAGGTEVTFPAPLEHDLEVEVGDVRRVATAGSRKMPCHAS